MSVSSTLRGQERERLLYPVNPHHKNERESMKGFRTISECLSHSVVVGIGGRSSSLRAAAAYRLHTTKYVPIETVRTDTMKVTKYERDSIYIHDSTNRSREGRHDAHREVAHQMARQMDARYLSIRVTSIQFPPLPQLKNGVQRTHMVAADAVLSIWRTSCSAPARLRCLKAP